MYLDHEGELRPLNVTDQTDGAVWWPPPCHTHKKEIGYPIILFSKAQS